jgi:hypothetical protein
MAKLGAGCLCVVKVDGLVFDGGLGPDRVRRQARAGHMAARR